MVAMQLGAEPAGEQAGVLGTLDRARGLAQRPGRLHQLAGAGRRPRLPDACRPASCAASTRDTGEVLWQREARRRTRSTPRRLCGGRQAVRADEQRHASTSCGRRDEGAEMLCQDAARGQLPRRAGDRRRPRLRAHDRRSSTASARPRRHAAGVAERGARAARAGRGGAGCRSCPADIAAAARARRSPFARRAARRERRAGRAAPVDGSSGPRSRPASSVERRRTAACTSPRTARRRTAT